jgi:hypothetical protein
MAPVLRLYIPGGWFHVVNRGVERRSIFPTSRVFSAELKIEISPFRCPFPHVKASRVLDLAGQTEEDLH